MKQRINTLLSKTPGLKGREIARIIGEERKAVNSFLSKNTDIFYKNDKYQWFVRNDDVVEVEFDSGWVDDDAFEAVLATHQDLFRVNKNIKFITPKGCKLLVVSIAKLLSLANQLALRAHDVTIDMSDCGDTRSFLNRAGFFDHLSPKVTVLPARPASSMAEKYKGNCDSLVEFGAIDPHSKNKPLIVQLGNAFVSKSSERFQTAALTVFSELIGNVSEHSESPIDGFAALQCYSPYGRPKHIQTVISDSGLGVSATLRPSLEQNYPSLYQQYSETSIDSDIGLVTEVFSKGNISRFGGARGLGFKSSREQTIKFDADLSIRQETFNIHLVYRRGNLVDQKVVNCLAKIQGTHLCFDFQVD